MIGKLYFCLTEESGQHIGVVQADTDDILNSKIALACTEHFDIEIDIPNTIIINNLLDGQIITIKLNGGEDYRPLITIVRSFLY